MLVGALVGCGQAEGEGAAPPSARWMAPQQLSTGKITDGAERAPFASDPRVAIDARGAAIVVYDVDNGREGLDVHVATAPPGQRVGACVRALADGPGVAKRAGRRDPRRLPATLTARQPRRG